MKKSPWRRQASAYPWTTDIQPRYSDVDMWQHLNNAALMAMHTENCQRWLCDHLGADAWRQASPGLVTLANQTDFLAESHYPAPLTGGVRLLGWGAQALHLASALFQHGQCVGLHQAWVGPWGADGAAPLANAQQARLAEVLQQQPALPQDVAAASDAGVSVTAPPAEALPQAVAPQWADLPWQSPLASRFADADGRGHASDLCLARCAEQMRVSFLTQVLGSERASSNVGFMVGHVSLHWLRRSKPPAQWRAGARVLRVGERAITVQGALFDGDTCCAVAESVLVCIDRQARHSLVMPDHVRQAVAGFGGSA